MSTRPPGDQTAGGRRLYDRLESPLSGITISLFGPYWNKAAVHVRLPVTRAVHLPIGQELRDWLDNDSEEVIPSVHHLEGQRNWGGGLKGFGPH